MTGWKAVWTIARFGWKRDWIGVMITFLFAMYVGGSIAFNLQYLLTENEPLWAMNMLVDWLYLMTFPAFGCLMNRTSFAIWRDDVYTRRIAHWRTMPIPLASIVQARLLQSVFQLPLIGFPFLFLQYALSPGLQELVSPMQLAAVGVIWICYSVVVNTVLVWLELSTSGKRYVQGYLMFILLCVAAAVICRLADVQLFRETLKLIESGQYGWLPVFAVIAGACGYAGYRMTLRTMRNRPYVF
ncbi:hypothetical protein E5161_16820 [Cohnella pontilimi]|uniref:ABC-2 type transport system permease protein n=1 Tax=Cohnella pontilimi TaxID=2564100 RepID=A0A4U0F856_9BACL|nr:hypothetical protein [Cohnella pontilimi]TJY40801.1 hypothetical protein E5161_16820 [Cohnella pontilimi]